ncbi:hypothetical protein HSE3_gp138 [Bacillus phage vB_BceM-HSE3]|nr:hypothetical protein HSE3_gp138 [Bacillus phage vB_BceM-HSE3]
MSKLKNISSGVLSTVVIFLVFMGGIELLIWLDRLTHVRTEFMYGLSSWGARIVGLGLATGYSFIYYHSKVTK